MKLEKLKKKIWNREQLVHLRTRKLSDYRDDRTVRSAEEEKQERQKRRDGGALFLLLSSPYLVETSTRVRITFIHMSARQNDKGKRNANDMDILIARRKNLQNSSLRSQMFPQHRMKTKEKPMIADVFYSPIPSSMQTNA